jgi:hypothetical protein
MNSGPTLSLGAGSYDGVIWAGDGGGFRNASAAINARLLQ